MNSIHVALIVLGVVAKSVCYPPCNTVPKKEINYDDLIRFSPFKMLMTNQNIYNCSRTLFVGPSPDGEKTGIVIVRGNFTHSYEGDMIDNSIFDIGFCATGVKLHLPTVFSNLKSRNRASFCVFGCAPNGIDYKVVNCLGRSEIDRKDILNFLNQTLPGVKTVFNPQQNCPKPEHCESYIN